MRVADTKAYFIRLLLVRERETEHEAQFGLGVRRVKRSQLGSDLGQRLAINRTTSSNDRGIRIVPGQNHTVADPCWMLAVGLRRRGLVSRPILGTHLVEGCGVKSARGKPG